MAVDPDIITLADIQGAKADICFLEEWIETTSLTLFTPDGKQVQSLEGVSNNSQVAINQADIATLFGLVGGGGAVPSNLTVYSSGAGNHIYQVGTAGAIIIARGAGGGGGNAADGGALVDWVSGGGGGQGGLSIGWETGAIGGASRSYSVGSGGAVETAGGSTTFGAPIIAAANGGGGGTLGTGGSGGLATSGDILALGGANGEIMGGVFRVTEGVVDGGRFNFMWGGKGGGNGISNGAGGDGNNVTGYWTAAAPIANGVAQAGQNGFIYVLEYA